MSGTLELPCANCGAPLTYSPGVDSLACEHCGAINDLPAEPEGPWERADLAIREHDYLARLETELPEAELAEAETVACPGCGAEVTFDDTVIAERCPFCATPLSREAAQTRRHPRPDGVLPFLLTEREARERMKRWLGRLWFAPSGLKSYAEAGRPMSGVYLPYYTYDALGEAEYRGQRGDAYYVTQHVNIVQDGKPRRVARQVRRMRWTPVSGRVRRAFDDVLIPASTTIEPVADRAEAGGRSWDLSALEPFRREFLAGFRAEAPSVGLEAGFARAAQVMEGILARDARFDIGGDAQRLTELNARYRDVTFKHVLLPLWIAAYRWRNKPYRVVINGRTGEVQGERPWSPWKIALTVAVVLIAAVAAGYFMAGTR